MIPIKSDSDIEFFVERLYWITAEFVNEFYSGNCRYDIKQLLVITLTVLRDLKGKWTEIIDVNSFMMLIAYPLNEIMLTSDCKLKVSVDFFSTQFSRSVEFKWAQYRSVFYQYRFYYRDKLLKLGFDNNEAKSIIESGMAWSETSTKYYYSY